MDESTDLDTVSAFGFQGQKCSACSRVVAVKEIADSLIHRLIEAAKSLRIGPPRNPENVMGPVIDEHALKKIQGYIRKSSDDLPLTQNSSMAMMICMDSERGCIHAVAVGSD